MSNCASRHSIASRLALGAVTLLLASLSLFAVERAEAQTFRVDVYVPALPVEGESDMMIQLPLVAGPDQVLRAEMIQVPGDAFKDKSIVPFNPAWNGGNLQKTVEAAFARANEKFAAAGVKFELRTVYVVSAKHPSLAPFYKADEEAFGLDIKDGKSGLLKNFADMTAANGSAFNVFMGPINGGTSGYSQTPGTTSVIDFSAAATPNMNGFGLVHELAHTLGVPSSAHRGESANHALSERVPNLQGNQKADPALEANEIKIIKENAGNKRYANTRTSGDASAETTKPAASSATTPKTKSAKTTPATKKKAAKKRVTKAKTRTRRAKDRDDAAGAAAADAIIRFGIGVGSEMMGNDRRDRHHDGQDNMR